MQDRAQLALLGLAAVHNVPVFEGPMTKETAALVYADEPEFPTSPFPLRSVADTRLKQAASAALEVPGSIIGTLGYQRWGYGLGSVSSRACPFWFRTRLSVLTPFSLLILLQADSKDIGDAQLTLGESRQGNPNVPDVDWRSQTLSKANLPHVIQMGEEYGYRREANATLDEELLWQNEMVRLLLKACLPKSYDIGSKCMKVIAENATELVAQKVEAIFNDLVGGASV